MLGMRAALVLHPPFELELFFQPHLGGVIPKNREALDLLEKILTCRIFQRVGHAQPGQKFRLLL